ncbi:MAG TPA: site-specific integrase [Chthoniobacterales bacterium]|nr:site-specific integrase [Chthoniobacterales bacterium]
MKKSANESAPKVWEKTKIQNLVRHKSGRYYARTFANKKEIWKSLRTEHFSVAKARLAEFLREQREKQAAANVDPSSAKMTFGEALAIHLQNLDDDVTIKPGTRHYWRQIFTALLKSWPGLAERELRRITKGDCVEWARRFRKLASSTRYNNTIAGLRHVFDVAVEAGIIYGNPATKLERVPVRAKQLTLPSRDEFLRLVDAVQQAGAWCSRDCADFLRGLAFTGCQKGEAAHIEWRDLDFDAGEIVVRGDSATGTKNWTVRRVPMIPDARALFVRMRSDRPDEPPNEKLFRVNEAQKAINSAVQKLGLPRITHHDLRHLFATASIESGVDIPTVSRWLGHKDGGALAMKTYGHLRREHSVAQAQKVSFAAAPAKQADVIHFPAASEA